MSMHLIIREQGERQLGSMDWLTGFGVKSQHLSEFGLFYDMFRNGQEFVVPAQLVINRAKRDLNGISGEELNWIREAFAGLTNECCVRLQ